VLDALASVEEAQTLALTPMDDARMRMSEQRETDHEE